MDSRNPFSQSTGYQSTGYLGLLNSQHDSVVNGNFPYESFNSQSSEIPLFSSQNTDAPTPAEHAPATRGKRQKWTPGDDEVLISAWLNTSKDAIVGNDQKLDSFWKRVGEYFAASPNGGCKRVHKHLKQRWHKINDLTNKFSGAYAAAERHRSSGQNDNDVLKAAHNIFYSDHKSKFNLEHAWCLLRYDQKWLNLNPPPPPKAAGSLKRKDGVEGSQASVNVGDTETRPEGIKAAKAKRNTHAGKSVDEYKVIWEMKKEDLASKEKLSKLAILDTLLAKDHLTEREEIAKENLLAQYL